MLEISALPRQFLLALHHARPIRPGPFRTAVRVSGQRTLDHHKRQPDHMPTSVKFPTFRVRKWISTTHEDNITTAGRRNITCLEMSYSGD